MKIKISIEHEIPDEELKKLPDLAEKARQFHQKASLLLLPENARILKAIDYLDAVKPLMQSADVILRDFHTQLMSQLPEDYKPVIATATEISIQLTQIKVKA